jgi:hypothetical protein
MRQLVHQLEGLLPVGGLPDDFEVALPLRS